MNYLCKICGKELSSDECGLYKKLVNRGAQEFMCYECMEKNLEIPVEKLHELVDRFRRDGCSLFN